MDAQSSPFNQNYNHVITNEDILQVSKQKYILHSDQLTDHLLINWLSN